MQISRNSSNPIYKVVGEKVRSCRLAKGYTQKDLAEKIGVKYWVILQYEKGNCRIPIKKLYKLAEALSVSIIDFIPEQRISEKCFENEGKEILNFAKEIKDQELCEILYLLTKFIRMSEERSGKAVKIEVARSLIKVGVSVDVISRATNLSIGEYEEKRISIDSIMYKIGQRIKERRLRREYTQADLASKVGLTNQRIYEYEQGRAAVSLETLDEIAKVLSISMTDLLPKSTEDEDSEVGRELSNLIKEYKKIENQELCHALIKSLFEGIRTYEEKFRKAEKIKVAKNLVKEGISIDIIVQTIDIPSDEIQ